VVNGVAPTRGFWGRQRDRRTRLPPRNWQPDPEEELEELNPSPPTASESSKGTARRTGDILSTRSGANVDLLRTGVRVETVTSKTRIPYVLTKDAGTSWSSPGNDAGVSTTIFTGPGSPLMEGPVTGPRGRLEFHEGGNSTCLESSRSTPNLQWASTEDLGAGRILLGSRPAFGIRVAHRRGLEFATAAAVACAASRGSPEVGGGWIVGSG